MVVHTWPVSCRTYWRASSQIGQRGGDSELGANWEPQVAQTKAVIADGTLPGMICAMRFDHMGVVVADLDAAVAFARDVLGLGEPQLVRNDEHGLDAAFFTFPGGSGVRIEFLSFDDAPTARLPEGAVGVLDHVAVEVDDLEAEASRLRSHGVEFTGPRLPDRVAEIVEMRGRKHLWSDPSTSLGFRLQMTETAP